MKKRLPAVEAALDTLLASNLRGQLRAGDSLGVWTFDRQVRTGQFPLQRWVPENAATIASNITRFVAKQHFSKKTSFEALRPVLDLVVRNSDRLTVVIYCDGDGQMTGTPYDAGINRIFQQQQAQQRKTRQPFIVVLRSQLGNYTGCTMNLPPALVNFPNFPPWPPPPRVLTNAPPPAAPANVPPTAPRPSVVAPPLIIIGTKPGTNPPPPAPLTSNQPPPSAGVPPAKATANAQTTALPLVATAQPTNQPVVLPVKPTAPAAAIPTDTVAAPAESSGLSTSRRLALGAVFLVMAGVLTLLLMYRARRADHGSLITRSMNQGGKPSARS
jgi:hypothetical protein